MRDVNYGWLLRYLHANGASAFFIAVYAHVGRGIYYASFKGPRTAPWTVGVVILVLMMGTAFLGYVMPYGQMSLWGATVITSMLSAIPWIGNSLTEFVITSPIGVMSCVFIACLCVLYATIANAPNELPTVGKPTSQALRTSRVPDGNKTQYLTIPLATLAFTVGLIDGDGYIMVVDGGDGSVRINIVISLSNTPANLAMLTHLRDTLMMGRVNIYPASGHVRLTINRIDLQQLLFPLLLHHNLWFITPTRRVQFELAMHVMLNGITRFSDVPRTVNTPVLPMLPSTGVALSSLVWFPNWVAGFVTADGSFHIKASGDYCFSVTQRLTLLLFEALLYQFGSTTSASLYTSGLYAKVSLSSVADLTRVVRFFSSTDHHPLMGEKALSYRVWLDSMRHIKRLRHLVP